MSIPLVRGALETALNAMIPALPTVFENQDYKPVPNVAFQTSNIVFSTPNNEEYGPNWQDLGIWVINLFYPPQQGPAATDARFELIRDTFARGKSFTLGGVVVTINSTPELAPAYNEDGFFVRPIRIRFYANQY